PCPAPPLSLPAALCAVKIRRSVTTPRPPTPTGKLPNSLLSTPIRSKYPYSRPVHPPWYTLANRAGVRFPMPIQTRPSQLSAVQLAAVIDHTMLRAYATQVDMDELCDEAVQYGFAAVSINPVWCSYCAKRLADSAVKVNATVGFPLGANTAHVKVEEAR